MGAPLVPPWLVGAMWLALVFVAMPAAAAAAAATACQVGAAYLVRSGRWAEPPADQQARFAAAAHFPLADLPPGAGTPPSTPLALR